MTPIDEYRRQQAETNRCGKLSRMGAAAGDEWFGWFLLYPVVILLVLVLRS